MNEEIKEINEELRRKNKELRRLREDRKYTLYHQIHPLMDEIAKLKAAKQAKLTTPASAGKGD